MEDKRMIPHIRRVYIRNYKSIAKLWVNLETFTLFVGPNGSGKSNFIDALSFVKDCLFNSIELAFTERGRIGAVRRRSIGHPTHIGIRLILELENDLSADYAFEIAAEPKERFKVARERCVIKGLWGDEYRFHVEHGKFIKEIPGIKPKLSPDRLALFAASATEEFRPVYDFLTSMRFYSIVPLKIRELQEPDSGDYLKRDGSNAASVLKRLREEPQGSERYQRICRLLSKVVEGIRGVEDRAVGQKETIQFKQDVGSEHPWTFDALNMSDGTLRVLGLLLSVFQLGHHSMVAIEEPEATVHPAVTELVIEVLMDASNERQVLLTTHSPDILDFKYLNDSQIRVVTMESERNRTLIAPVSNAGRDAIRMKLYTPGELLRAGELSADINEALKAAKQRNLFGAPILGTG